MLSGLSEATNKMHIELQGYGAEGAEGGKLFKCSRG